MQSQKIKEYYKQKFVQKKLIKKYQELKNESIIHRIIENLRSRSFNYLKLFNLKHMEILGCSASELEEFLKNKFAEGMTMENYSEWEVDHIKPVSKFNLTDEKEIRECFHYTNLQPLWMIDNRKKSNKYIDLQV